MNSLIECKECPKVYTRVTQTSKEESKVGALVGKYSLPRCTGNWLGFYAVPEITMIVRKTPREHEIAEYGNLCAEL